MNLTEIKFSNLNSYLIMDILLYTGILLTSSIYAVYKANITLLVYLLFTSLKSIKRYIWGFKMETT
jgi:hypothetical protein